MKTKKAKVKKAKTISKKQRRIVVEIYEQDYLKLLGVKAKIEQFRKRQISFADALAFILRPKSICNKVADKKR